MGIEESIVLVKSSGDRNDIGTGFIIFQDSTASYVLTCAHVVNAVGGRGSVQVDRWDAEVIAYGFEPKEEGLDLAILRVEGLKKPIINLWTFCQEGDPFKVYGYHRFDDKRTYRRVCVEGKLDKQAVVRSDGEDIRAWDLIVTGDNLLKSGCSGAPVLNQRNEAIGIITHQLLDGKRGAALSIETLEQVKNWRVINILPHLYIPQYANYTNLRNLLAAADWQLADDETFEVMCEIAQARMFLSREALEHFPCKDLRTIDQLWLHYSQGKFGFSVQKQIWQKCGSPCEYNKNWRNFGDLLGWRVGGKWMENQERVLQMHELKEGYFPFKVFNKPEYLMGEFAPPFPIVDLASTVSSFFKKLTSCC